MSKADRMEAAERRRELETEVIRAQFAISPDGILALTPAGEILSFNQRFLDIWTLDRETMAGLDGAGLIDLLEPQVENAVELQARLEEIHVAQRTPGVLDVCMRDGRWVELRTLPVDLAGGEQQARIGFFRDVTEHKTAEASLRETEGRFRQLAENIDAVFWLTDTQTGQLIYISPSFDRIWGFDRQRLLDNFDAWWRHIHPGDVEWLKVALLNHSAGDSTLEFRIVRPDGSIRWLRDRAFPVRDERGEIVRVAGIADEITQERAAAEALHVAHTQLGHILATSPTVLYTLHLRADGRVLQTWVSDNFAGILGYPRAAVLEPDWWYGGLHPADREAAGRFSRVLQEQDHYAHEYRFRDHEGVYRWLHDSMHVVGRNENGTIEVVGSWTDVSAQKRSDTMIRESERSYRSLFDNLTELVFIIGADRQLLSVNDATLRRTGMAWESFLGRQLPSVLAREADATAVRTAIELAASGTPQRIESWAATAAGGRFPVDITLTRGHYFGADVVVAVARDVSEARRARGMLAAAEAHYRRLVDASPYGIFVLDLEGDLIELNRAAESVIGRSEPELMGKPFATLIDEADLPQAEAAFHRWMAGHGVGEDIEIRLVHPSGERRLLQLRGAPIVEGDQVVGVHGVARDITDERQREEAARLLAAALEGLEEGVAIYTEAGDVVYHNAAHARILDYDPDGPVPNILSFAPDEKSRQDFIRGMRAALASGSWSGRLRRRRLRDERIIPLQVLIGRMDRGDGATLLISIVRDNSEDLAAESRLQRAERLASVGTLIGGVAHELNNPLHAIRNFAELLLESPRDAEEREDLDTIRREADRAARIVSDLRLLAWQSQTEEGAKQPVDLNDVIDHVLRVRNYSLTTSNIVSQRDFATVLPPILGDRGKLEQVVLNLVVNAEQAMAEQGREKRLTLRTRGGDRRVTLTVSDTGTGIAQDNLMRLFDPFWTTKAPGEGTGLGLPLVHGIVKEHGGEIHVESELGRGTSFRVEFPIAPQARAEPPPPLRETEPAGRPLRILVVEDEAALRRSLERYLRRRGHKVVCAAEGSEALRLLDSDGEFDAILSDLRMPGMSGEGLVTRLRADPRGLHRRLILMTGDAASPQAVKVLMNAGVPVLVKPIPLPALSRAVEERAAAARVFPDLAAPEG